MNSEREEAREELKGAKNQLQVLSEHVSSVGDVGRGGTLVRDEMTESLRIQTAISANSGAIDKSKCLHKCRGQEMPYCEQTDLFKESPYLVPLILH